MTNPGETQKKEITFNSARQLPHYDAHLVPCIINYDGSTSELPKNFESEPEASKSIESQPSGTREIKYLRGRKLVGQEVSISTPENKNFETYILDTDSNKICCKVNALFNYEREGNEKRLVAESARFHEFLETMETIMDE
ncbi:hypothetical protein ACO0QE_002185 [Hanseniaspora vineae]